MKHIVRILDWRDGTARRRLLALAGMSACLVIGATGMWFLPRLWQVLSLGGVVVVAGLYLALAGIGNEFDVTRPTHPERSLPR